MIEAKFHATPLNLVRQLRRMLNYKDGLLRYMPGDAGFLCYLVSHLWNTPKPLSGILLWDFFWPRPPPAHQRLASSEFHRHRGVALDGATV